MGTKAPHSTRTIQASKRSQALGRVAALAADWPAAWTHFGAVVDLARSATEQRRQAEARGFL